MQQRRFLPSEIEILVKDGALIEPPHYLNGFDISPLIRGEPRLVLDERAYLFVHKFPTMGGSAMRVLYRREKESK